MLSPSTPQVIHLVAAYLAEVFTLLVSTFWVAMSGLRVLK